VDFIEKYLGFWSDVLLLIVVVAIIAVLAWRILRKLRD